MLKMSLKLVVIFALAISFGAFITSADEKDKSKKSKKPTTAGIKVKTESGTYPVYIDGEQVGMSTVEEGTVIADNITPGERDVEVRWSNGTTWKGKQTFIAGRNVCLCFKKVTTVINTPCPHLVQVDVPDAVTEGDLVTFTSNVNVNPNPNNISPALVNFNDFKSIENLSAKLRDKQTPAAQCVYNRFSPKTRTLLDGYTSNGSTATLSRADFVDPATIAVRLRTTTTPLTVYIKDQMSSSSKKMVNKFDLSGTTDGNVAPELLEALIVDFNKIVNGPSIYNAERFNGVPLSAEARDLSSQPTLDADKTKRLNRLLLEAAFQKEIARSSSGNQNNLELGNALADEFNLLIKGPALTNMSCFSGVAMSAPTKKLSAGGLTGEGLKSFNRLLLEDSFPGEIARLGTITAQFNTPVRYVWTVTPSNARIIGPSDRDSITVDSTGLGNQTIAAKLTIDDGREDNLCRQMDDALTRVRAIELPKPKKWKHDEFPSRAMDDYKARLDAYVIELQNKPDAKGYMISYSGSKTKPAQAQKLNAKAIEYLVKTRGLPAERITVIQGGRKEGMDDDYIELWIVEAGADAPTPNSRGE